MTLIVSTENIPIAELWTVDYPDPPRRIGNRGRWREQLFTKNRPRKTYSLDWTPTRIMLLTLHNNYIEQFGE